MDRPTLRQLLADIAACDQRACRLDRRIVFFEDSAGMVLVAIEVQVDRCVATVFLLAGNRLPSIVCA